MDYLEEGIWKEIRKKNILIWGGARYKSKQNDGNSGRKSEKIIREYG